MRYQIYTNETIDPKREYCPSTGYVLGAHMQLSYTGEIETSTSSPSVVLDLLFEKFNMDYPADYRAHSLSIGDVIVLEGVSYACVSVGWDKLKSFLPAVKNPFWLTSALLTSNGLDVQNDFQYKDEDRLHVNVGNGVFLTTTWYKFWSL